MKIAILSCFYPYRGGISQFNAALLDELGRHGAEVRAFNFKRQYPELLFPGKTQYVTADDQTAPVQSTAVLDTVNPLSYFTTYRKIRQWGPDVVIVRYWMSWFAPSLGYVTRHLRRHGIKVISILDNVVPHEPHFFDRPLTSWFLKGSDACITLCEAVADDLRAIRKDLPCKVLPHPLYTHFGEKLSRDKALTALGLDPSCHTLLYFGLIREYKGLDILLDAFPLLPEQYQLIIAGEPYGSFEPYARRIEAMDEGRRNRIFTRLEYISDADVKYFFSGADLCVLPYRSATQSGVSAISFHFEVPMLVTDTGGLKETIADTGTGLLAESCTAQAIASGIERYFSNGSVAAECRKNIEIQKDRLSWKTFADSLLSFINSL
ncbi:MAG: glycosyltransferase [Bacteroidales bacterium]|nr:glycosyltransferase [Candidatus Hennigimonas equi]